MPDTSPDAARNEVAGDKNYHEAIREQTELAALEKAYANIADDEKGPARALRCLITIVTRELAEALRIRDPDPAGTDPGGKHAEWARGRAEMLAIYDEIEHRPPKPVSRPVVFRVYRGDAALPMYSYQVVGDLTSKSFGLAVDFDRAYNRLVLQERRRAYALAAVPWEGYWVKIRRFLAWAGKMNFDTTFSTRIASFTDAMWQETVAKHSDVYESDRLSGSLPGPVAGADPDEPSEGDVDSLMDEDAAEPEDT